MDNSLNRKIKKASKGKLLSEDVQHLRRLGVAVSNSTQRKRRLLRNLSAWWKTTSVEKFLEDIAFLLKNAAILDLVNLAASLIIILGLVSWWTGRQERWENEIFSTWGVIKRATGDQSGVAKVAMERLNTNNFSLQGLDFSYSNLKGAYLKGAYLEQANLKGANLKRANLKEANLKGANLEEAYLSRANLEGTDLERVNLSRTYLEGAYLEEANLEGVSLEGANLEEADLRKANLRRANLKRAKLWRANLRQSYLLGANLERADLWGADLRGANLLGANLKEANLLRANLLGADLGGANLLGANLKEAKYDKNTKFPSNFNPKEEKMLVELYK